MVRITEELVRKRAEHNDGCISDLKEIALHQFEIEKIENLGQLCRHLEILFLQNNLISKIDDLLSISSLAPNYNLKDLFLIGNPITKHPKYRSFIVASLPSLKCLDGQEITEDERTAAIAELPEVRAQLLAEKAQGIKIETPNFTPEDRVKVYKELAEKRGDTAPEDTKPAAQPIPPPPAPGETARGINQAKLEFKLLEDDDNNIIIDLACGKYLDTSLIEVDAQPSYVRVIIKGKLFQLPLPEEVNPDSGTARRSTITGNLVLTLPKVKQVLKSQTTPAKKITPAPREVKPNEKSETEGRGLSGAVDIRNIVQNAEKEKKEREENAKKEKEKAKVSEVQKHKSGAKVEYDFDESEVPPLE